MDAWLNEITEIPSADVLVPVPLHPIRLAARGYNQSELLAERLGQLLSVRVDHTVLARVEDTPAQVAVPPKERWANVRSAFQAADHAFAGKAVLIVDDVATTASTLRAVAAVVARSGALRVDALVIARAGFLEPGDGTRVASPDH